MTESRGDAVAAELAVSEPVAPEASIRDSERPAGAGPALDVEMGDVVEAPAASEAGAEPAMSEVPSDATTPTPCNAHMHSRWRWPSRPGKLPGYIRGRFRAKTFAVLASQLLLVLCLMVVVELTCSGIWKRINGGVVCFVLELCTMLMLVQLHCFRDRYPANYILLGFITLMVGLRWGASTNLFADFLHFQVVGILCLAMCIAAVTSLVRAHHGAKGWPEVVSPLMLGWSVGAAVDLLVCARIGVSMLWSLLAIVVTFCLLGWLLVDVGRRLVDSNPDDFMRVVVAMNSTLLVVVSIPVFAFGTFLIHATDQDSDFRIGALRRAHQGPAAAPEPGEAGAGPALWVEGGAVAAVQFRAAGV